VESETDSRGFGYESPSYTLNNIAYVSYVILMTVDRFMKRQTEGVGVRYCGIMSVRACVRVYIHVGQDSSDVTATR
jgi:hypothetical protein